MGGEVAEAVSVPLDSLGGTTALLDEEGVSLGDGTAVVVGMTGREVVVVVVDGGSVLVRVLVRVLVMVSVRVTVSVLVPPGPIQVSPLGQQPPAASQ
jgi:hypothetical protein